MANKLPKDLPSLGLAPHPSSAHGPSRIQEMSRDLPSGADPEESEFRQKLLTSSPSMHGGKQTACFLFSLFPPKCVSL